MEGFDDARRARERRMALDKLQGDDLAARTQRRSFDSPPRARHVYASHDGGRRLSESNLGRVEEEFESPVRPGWHRAQTVDNVLTPTRRLVLKRSSTVADVPFPSNGANEVPQTAITLQREKRWNSDVCQSLQPAIDLSSSKSRIMIKETTYQIGNAIGRGQFGIVYRALNVATGRIVAVKRIAIEGKSQEQVDELAEEVDVLKSISHPSCVAYLGAVVTRRHFNIVLEYVENGSLLDTLKSFGGSFSEPLAANYIVKILEGLSYLHRNMIIHCDLKAANVLTTKNGNIKLSDFGVSLNVTVNTEKIVQGTPNWMAPEIIELKGAVTASDIWSLGALAIELFTGHAPYHDLMPMTVLYRIVEDDMPPLPSDASIELIDFWYCCFNKTPALRPTAPEMMSHPWLVKQWDPTIDLSAKDSIPFLRRISREVRPDSLDGGAPASPGSPPVPLSPSAALLNALASSSSDGHSSGIRFSLDGQRASLPASHTSPITREISSPVSSTRHHAFVKSNFGRAVQCRICPELVKRKGLLCDGCGLVCHAECSQFASTSCDMRMALHPSSSMPVFSAQSMSDKRPSFAQKWSSRQSAPHLPVSTPSIQLTSLSASLPASSRANYLFSRARKQSGKDSLAPIAALETPGLSPANSRDTDEKNVLLTPVASPVALPTCPSKTTPRVSAKKLKRQSRSSECSIS